MNPLLRKLLFLFFAVWLPASSVAAAMMPVCAHDKAKQMHAAHAMDHGGEQHHGSSDQPAAEESTAADECAQCGLCLFASTPWLPGTWTAFDTGSTLGVIDGIFPALHSLAIPPADRPPLAAA